MISCVIENFINTNVLIPSFGLPMLTSVIKYYYKNTYYHLNSNHKFFFLIEHITRYEILNIKNTYYIKFARPDLTSLRKIVVAKAEITINQH